MESEDEIVHHNLKNRINSAKRAKVNTPSEKFRKKGATHLPEITGFQHENYCSMRIL